MKGFSQDFETISHFCRSDFFFLIMNKQESVTLPYWLVMEIEKL